MTDKPTPPSKPIEPPQSTPEELRLHPILTNKEVLEGKAKAKKAISDERKKQALEALIAQETNRLRMEEGFSEDASPGGELVNVTVNLAKYADRITLDNRIFMHGRTYPVPRRVAESIRDICSQTWRHDHSVKNQPMSEFYANPHMTEFSMVSGIAKNAPTAPG